MSEARGQGDPSREAREGPPSAEALRDEMLGELLEAGFDLAGCLPLEDAGDERFAEWLARGHAGEMRWMERHLEAKATPALHWPRYRSVLVVALEYGESTPPAPDARVANISRYALGTDYHDVLKQRLLAAADRMRARFPDLETRAFVDTGPLNEKLVAERAGLGWRGKNTNLIHERRGSWLFLGVLLTSAALPATPADARDRCGLCEACLPACPTDAFVGPYLLDARRCLSYLTIELKGPIPRAFRPLLGNRVFGCDDCQEVCPWNRFARRHPPPELAPRPGLRERTLAEWLATDLEEWRRLFRRSAVKRTGYEGFLRNVLYACGASGHAELADAVRPFLAHASPLLRGCAAWALGALLGPVASADLRPLLDDPDPTVREEAREAFA